MFKHIAILLVSWLTLCAASEVRASDEFLQIYTELYVPNSYRENDTGPVVGYVTDLVREVMATAGIDYEIEMVPWIRAVQALESTENVMVYSMARTPEREDKYHWIGKTLPLEFYLYGMKERLMDLPKTLETAIDSRIGVVREDVVGLYLESKQFTGLVYVRRPSLYLNMLERNRIDLFPFTPLEIGLFARINGYNENDLIGIIKLDELSTDQYMVVGKNTDQAVQQRLMSAYQQVVDSGKYEELLKPLYLQYETIRVDILE